MIVTWRCIRADMIEATGPRNQFQSQNANRMAVRATTATAPPLQARALRLRGLVVVSAVKGMGSGAPSDRRAQPNA